MHRDIKPANLWLRMPLARGERFDPQKHRDPAIVPPLATVVIDFGMVRAIHVSSEVAGRFVAGTAGYIAPEQVLDPVELDPRADVYALAGTIYNVTTGRAFFDEIDNPRDRIIAHMSRDPFEDVERLKGFPPSVAKLLRAATATKPGDRPEPDGIRAALHGSAIGRDGALPSPCEDADIIPPSRPPPAHRPGVRRAPRRRGMRWRGGGADSGSERAGAGGSRRMLTRRRVVAR